MDRQVLVKKDRLFSDSGNRLPHFNPFAAAFASIGPAERNKLSLWGLLNF